jgi:isopenicillin N synthase-like dioxygenase
MTEGFAASRERELLAESETWELSRQRAATEEELPTVDIGNWLTDRDPQELERLADKVRVIGEQVGFHLLVGHGIASDLIEEAFAVARQFFALPDEHKLGLATDTEQTKVPGAGYLPVGTRKLPRRAKGNLNEALIFKRDVGLGLDDAAWPDPEQLPEFRPVIEQYATEIERVAQELVPIYARALDLPTDFFAAAMEQPFSRLRFSRYEPVAEADADEFGIAPHVDTTFFTLLAQDRPGLMIRGERTGEWLAVPAVSDALVVNTGELLKQWSNDRFTSVKHFVPPNFGPDDRYSIPFFFNANADTPMTCLPTCTGPGNPPRYPPVSYRESQAAAQGE